MLGLAEAGAPVVTDAVGLAVAESVDVILCVLETVKGAVAVGDSEPVPVRVIVTLCVIVWLGVAEGVLDTDGVLVALAPNEYVDVVELVIDGIVIDAVGLGLVDDVTVCGGEEVSVVEEVVVCDCVCDVV